MPTYEYECTKCGNHFERFQNMTEEPLKRCPKCRSKVRRLLGSGAGIIFKGSGFYQTDYRSQNYCQSTKSEASSKSESKDTGKKATATEKKATKTAATKE